MFGGAIVPRWEAPPPSWMRWLDLGPIFTITPPAMKEGSGTPFNECQDLIRRFAPPRSDRAHATILKIGPRGSSYPMGSETELLLRLSRQGHKAWHVQGAVVEHLVRKEQLNKAWILQRAIGYRHGWY